MIYSACTSLEYNVNHKVIFSTCMGYTWDFVTGTVISSLLGSHWHNALFSFGY